MSKTMSNEPNKPVEAEELKEKELEGVVGGRSGAGIGGGDRGGGGTVTIDGGSVKASSIQGQPHNGSGQNVYRVTVEVEALKVEKLKVEGLQNYGTKDIVPIDGKVYLYLPNGAHSFSLSDGTTTLSFYAVVKGRDTTVEPQGRGFTVNGTVITTGTGAGWNYDLNGCLHFTGGGTYVLSGMAMSNAVQVSVEASDAKLVFSNAVVYAHGLPAADGRGDSGYGGKSVVGRRERSGLYERDGRADHHWHGRDGRLRERGGRAVSGGVPVITPAFLEE